MFSDQFRRQLALGKYTQWASDLTESDLQALFWMIGEFGQRAPLVRAMLDSAGAETNRNPAVIRARLGVESVLRIVEGDRFDVEQARRLIREAVNAWERTQSPN